MYYSYLFIYDLFNNHILVNFNHIFVLVQRLIINLPILIVSNSFKLKLIYKKTRLINFILCSCLHQINTTLIF